MASGHVVSPKYSIPWPLATTSTDVAVSVDNDVINLSYKKNNKQMKCQVKGLDIHVMHKKSMEAISATS